MGLDRYDMAALVGLGLLAWGAALIYAPLGLIILGAGLMAFGVAGARNADTVTISQNHGVVDGISETGDRKT